jgi:NAD(P)-dependent dehydrogenase (short-subunit alcohol dehydrogenase family)
MSKEIRQFEEALEGSAVEGTNSLHGRTVMVTGGARGIGRAIVERVQAAGAQVCIIDCDPEAGEAVARALSDRYPDRLVRFFRGKSGADERDRCRRRALRKQPRAGGCSG